MGREVVALSRVARKGSTNKVSYDWILCEHEPYGYVEEEP